MKQAKAERPVRGTWGGKRAGAGRKPGPHPVVTRTTRPAFRKDTPQHVTLRVLPEAAGLRKRDVYREVRKSLWKSGHKQDFRICEYSLQDHHLHLICEASDADALARGIQGLSSSVARRLNQLRGTRGKVFADRYDARALRTAVEVRDALSYVLNNWRRQRIAKAQRSWRTDPYSSADLFDGWETSTGTGARRPQRPAWLLDDEPIPTARPRSRLLATGWRALGLLSPLEVPDLPERTGPR